MSARAPGSGAGRGPAMAGAIAQRHRPQESFGSSAGASYPMAASVTSGSNTGMGGQFPSRHPSGAPHGTPSNAVAAMHQPHHHAGSSVGGPGPSLAAGSIAGGLNDMAAGGVGRALDGVTRGPGAQEIVEYARYIGMDPINDVNLLWIAEEALTAQLPDGWAEHVDAGGNAFYYNSRTGVSTWEHPLDEYYRSLFLKLKKILVDNRAASKINVSAVLLQNAYRQHLARKSFRSLLGKHRLDLAATQMQRIFRGFSTRAKLREERLREWLELERFSATRLQSTFRAHRVRRSMAAIRRKWAEEQRRRMAMRIQSVFRGHLGRRRAREEEMFQSLELDEYACNKLQAVFRGHLGRRLFRLRLTQSEAERVFNAAASVQACWKGHVARRAVRDWRARIVAELRSVAAVRLQSVYRGHIARDVLRSKVALRSCIKLQAVWRGHVGRRDCNMKLRVQCTTLLQSVWRGHLGRLKFISDFEEDERQRALQQTIDASNKIQSVYRGHIVRRYVSGWVVSSKAALQLQSVWRGHVARGWTARFAVRQFACFRLQSVVRGHAARNTIRRIHQQRRVSMLANRIQKAWKGHAARSSLREELLQQAAAKLLQRRYRGHVVRRFVCMTPERKAEAHRCANVIQTTCRARMARVLVGNMLMARRKYSAATTIMCHWKGHAMRQKMQRVMTVLNGSTVIQCALRQHFARNRMREAFERKRVFLLATSIQKHWRQHHARALFKKQVVFIGSVHRARDLQRVYRGHLYRRAFGEALRLSHVTCLSDAVHDSLATKYSADAGPVKRSGRINRGPGAGPVSRVATGNGGNNSNLKSKPSKSDDGTAAQDGSPQIDASAVNSYEEETEFRWPPSLEAAEFALRLIAVPRHKLVRKEVQESRLEAKMASARAPVVVPPKGSPSRRKGSQASSGRPVSAKKKSKSGASNSKAKSGAPPAPPTPATGRRLAQERRERYEQQDIAQRMGTEQSQVVQQQISTEQSQVSNEQDMLQQASSGQNEGVEQGQEAVEQAQANALKLESEQEASSNVDAVLAQSPTSESPHAEASMADAAQESQEQELAAADDSEKTTLVSVEAKHSPQEPQNSESVQPSDGNQAATNDIQPHLQPGQGEDGTQGQNDVESDGEDDDSMPTVPVVVPTISVSRRSSSNSAVDASAGPDAGASSKSQKSVSKVGKKSKSSASSRSAQQGKRVASVTQGKEELVQESSASQSGKAQAEPLDQANIAHQQGANKSIEKAQVVVEEEPANGAKQGLPNSVDSDDASVPEGAIDGDTGSDDMTTQSQGDLVQDEGASASAQSGQADISDAEREEGELQSLAVSIIQCAWKCHLARGTLLGMLGEEQVQGARDSLSQALSEGVEVLDRQADEAEAVFMALAAGNSPAAPIQASA